MKKINDEKKLRELIRQYRINGYFSDQDLPFELYSFEKKEYLNNLLDPVEYFSFITTGTIRILFIRDDGSLFELAGGSGFTLLGDLEFGLGRPSPFLIEVVRKTWCVSLPLDLCRDKLEKDPVFLNRLLKSVSEKLDAISSSLSVPASLEEKVVLYMDAQCPGKTLKGVEKASYALSCSKRQLLRILKKLCEEGTAEKTGKGTYTLKAEAR